MHIWWQSRAAILREFYSLLNLYIIEMIYWFRFYYSSLCMVVVVVVVVVPYCACVHGRKRARCLRINPFVCDTSRSLSLADGGGGGEYQIRLALFYWNICVWWMHAWRTYSIWTYINKYPISHNKRARLIKLCLYCECKFYSFAVLYL